MLTPNAYGFAVYTGFICGRSDEHRCLSLSLQDKRGIDRAREEEQLEIERMTSGPNRRHYSLGELVRLLLFSKDCKANNEE